MRAWNVSVKGQTLFKWYVDDYFFGANGLGNGDIAGFYVDVSAMPSASW